jgi:hypothetical protein
MLDQMPFPLTQSALNSEVTASGLPRENRQKMTSRTAGISSSCQYTLQVNRHARKPIWQMVDTDRRIVLVLYIAQHIYVHDNEQAVRHENVSSGLGDDPTPICRPRKDQYWQYIIRSTDRIA